MWIKNIKIENFRNYRGIVSFDLNKKITIIYGDNGYGKSSFFDAIEWGLTGAIKRFEQNDYDKEFDNIDLINEDVMKQGESVCSVTLFFGNYALKRHFSASNGKTNNTYVELRCISSEDENRGETIYGKANVESKLRTIFMPNLNDNTLDIKQPFVLSQDQVTDFVLKDKPKQRYKALANLVGLNKIINYSDNLRLLIRELNNRSKDSNETVIKTQAIIDSYLSHKGVNINEIIEDARALSIKLPQKIDDYQVAIDESRYDVNSKIINTEKLLQLLDDYSKEDNLNYKMMVINKDNLRLSSKRLERHITEVKGSITKLTKKLVEVEKNNLNQNKLKESLDQQNNNNNKIKIKRSQIQELGFPLDLNINSINNKIEQISNELELHNYNLSYYDDYHNINEENRKVSTEIIEITSKSKFLKNVKKRKEKWINKISKWILENSEDSYQLKLLELLHGINEYLIKTRENTVCPVCSSNQEGNLIEISNENIKNMSDLLYRQTTKVKKVLELKVKVENSLNRIKSEIKNIENRVENLNRINEKNNNRLNIIKSNEIFDVSIIVLSREEIVNTIEKLSVEYENLNKLKTYYIQLIELERKDKVLNENVKEVSQLIANNNLEILNLYNNLFIKRGNYLEEIKEILSRVIKEYDRINLKINMLAQHGADKDEVPFSEKFHKLENNYRELQNKIDGIDRLNEKYSNFKRSQNIEMTISKAKREQQSAKNKLDFINGKIEIINKYIYELNEKVGTEAIDFLNQENSSVQQLYRYLNPMVSSKQLKFVAEEEELSIKVTSQEESGKETSAKYVLSSGQMNVLALSIFLSVNDAMDSELNFVAIDDPIQNMDDVNQFSVCDILSNLRRQLIFSTHDLDFIKLFVKKNEHLNGIIQVYMLKEPVISSMDSIEQIIFGEVMKKEEEIL